MDTEERTRASHEALAGRVAALPRIAREALEAPLPAPPFDPGRVRRLQVTGLGSSEAHARLLVACLADLGFDARFVPTNALRAGPPRDASRDALVVFSQGLSPNARFALGEPEAWRGLGLASAVRGARTDAARRALLERVTASGAWHVTFPPDEESGMLVRVAGPLAGCITAIRMAEQLAAAAGRPTGALQCTPGSVVEAIRRADGVVEAALAPHDDAVLDAPVGFLASGGYAGLLHNLRLKWLEALLRPLPPSWELLDFSHGPYQESLTRDATWVALTRADATGEPALLERIESMLDPARHRLLRLGASLPGPWALVEHEAQLDALVLRALARTRVDLSQWPGKDRDGALYDLAPDGAAPPVGRGADAPVGQRLDAAHWPDLARRLEQGATQVLVPLGATEQHGAHLPLATDTWIADALADALCARHPELLRLAALPLGCSEEHAAFPGTLSLRPDTLVAVLSDVLASLAAHGFERAFVFSAHGGNCAALERALPSLRAAAKPLRVDAFTDLAALARLQHQVAADHGVPAAAAGHHAGEFETSLLLALAPQHVRRDALAPGRLHPEPDAQALFYPDLRPNAPSGVVGDPRPAAAERAADYLERWVELLDASYRATSGG